MEATPLETTFAASLGRLMTFADIDARTLPVRKVQTLVRRLTNDLGGDLSTAQHALVVRAATLMALCEHSEVMLLTGQPIPLGDYLAAANTLKRILSALGLRRVPREVGTFSDLWLQDQEAQRRQREAAPP